MKFYPLTPDSPEPDQAELSSEYAAGREIGKIHLGELRLYFKSNRRGRAYYIPYHDVKRVFRRVQLVPARLCCGRGNFEVENLVVCGEDGELAQIQLPGSRAAKAIMEELKVLIPEAEFGRPHAPAAPQAEDTGAVPDAPAQPT